MNKTMKQSHFYKNIKYIIYKKNKNKKINKPVQKECDTCDTYTLKIYSKNTFKKKNPEYMVV
jgi:hypothetical protein